MQRCLVLYSDDVKASTWEVDLAAPTTDWNNLQSMTAIQTLTVKGDKNVDMTRTMLQLVVAIQPHLADIRTVKFVNCQIKELGHWCVMASQFVRDNRDPLLTMEFEQCDIELSAALNLSYMLQANFIGGLAIEMCSFHVGALEIISEGVRVNQSLREFRCHQMTSGTNSALAMLSVNHNIKKLGLDMTNEDCWDIYRAAESHPTLKSLKLQHANMDVASVGAIMKLCQDTPSLTSLDFNTCHFTQTGLQFLTEQLSKHVTLDSIKFVYCDAQPTNSDGNAASIELKWDSLNVKNFEYSSNTFGDGFTSTLLDKIASNNVINQITLFGVVSEQTDCRKLCDAFFLQNRGPPCLAIDSVGSHASMIVDALLPNTRLEKLVIGGVDADGYMAFARGLANMRALRKLSIGYTNIDNEYSTEFFQALQDSLKSNTTLMSLKIRGISAGDDMVKPFIPMIRYYLSINRIGRLSLSTPNCVPVGLLAHVLARSSAEPDGIYFALTGKPDLCQFGRFGKLNPISCDVIAIAISAK